MELKCIIIDDEPHALSELEDLVECCPHLTSTGSFRDVGPALSFLQDYGAVEIIFSDIHMSSMNGIDSARLLKRYCRFLVFVTAHREYAFEAFGVSAAGYLVKPVSRAVFLEKVNELIEQTNSHGGPAETNENILFVKGGSKNNFTKINVNEIVFIEGLLNYVIIHTANNRQITYMGMKEIIKKLEHKGAFIRVNKSIIVSVNHISHIDGNMVHLSNKNFYAIGNMYKSAFHEFIAKRTLNTGLR